MSQETHSNSDLMITDRSLERVFYSAGISSLFKRQYPHVYELLKYNFEGATNILCLQGSFQLYKFDQTMRYQQTGTDNIKTWLDYLAGIMKYLKALNDDCRLETARTKLAEHIHSVHYEKFPYWPNIGVEFIQQSEVFLDICDSHKYEQYIVGWSCHGMITVQDIRPMKDQYYTDFHGHPEFKVLYCNQRKLTEFEQLASSSMNQAKMMADKANKPLSWDTLNSMLTSGQRQ